jgi:hypothetical protein
MIISEREFAMQQGLQVAPLVAVVVDPGAVNHQRQRHRSMPRVIGPQKSILEASVMAVA